MNKMMQPHEQAGNGESAVVFATEPLDVLDAAYHTAHNYPGGVVPLAFRMGLPASTLNHKVNPHNSTHQLSLKEAVSMQAVSGDASILHAMAGALGYVAIKADATVKEQPMAEVAAMVREFGELLSSVTQSISDGSVTLNEVRECQRQAVEAIVSIYSVMSSVRSMLEQPRA